MIHDVVIVGSGPAGYTAAIYAPGCAPWSSRAPSPQGARS